jgi:hypothetical protein
LRVRMETDPQMGFFGSHGFLGLIDFL